VITEQININIDARLAEVQKLLSHIKKLEQAAIIEGDVVSGEHAAILRGLFFVHLYGAFEYAMTLSVQVLLQEMTKVSVPYSRIQNILHSVALDAEFRSVVDATGERKWAKRKDLLKRQTSDLPWALNDTVFDALLQNVWYDALSEIFECLCMPFRAVPEDRLKGYIDDVVRGRNAVAHGDSSASKEGRLTTSEDHQKRLEAITQVINHVVTSFEVYLANRHFVTEGTRSEYLASSTVSPIPAA
jgi:hypothetical protein